MATMTSTSTIKRDAAAQSKGPRLQKLRAAELLLDSLDKYELVNVCCATELDDDVTLTTASTTETQKLNEQNKQFDDAVTFTFASDAVLNSMVNFADCWIEQRLSTKVVFAFYAPNNIGQEHQSERTKKLGIVLPSEPILKYLVDSKLDEPNVLPSVKSFVLHEYKKQYKKHKKLGNIAIIEKWSDADWKAFLSQIRWKLGAEDAKALKETLLKKIAKAPCYSASLVGREAIILSCILEKFDEKQLAHDFPQRFVHLSEIRLIFRDVEAGSPRNPDPTWSEFERIECSDKRNLKDKVTGVCNGVRPETITRLQRRASASLAEQQQTGHSKPLLSLKYQIYDECEEKLSKLRQTSTSLTEQQLEQVLSELYESAKQRIKSRSADYSYPFTNEQAIRDMVLELFDSCYLSFDR